jgi:hypothetical protein
MSQQPPPPPPPGGDPQYPTYPQGNPQGNPQQPPQGQQPYPPQQPYQPYGQQYPPNPYGPGPGQQQKNHTTRNVLIIVAVLVVLFCGGSIVGIALLIGKAGDSIEDAFNTDYRGSENDPIEVEEGESFEIRGFEYDDGWTVGPDDTGSGLVEIAGLAATNNRDDGESYTVSLVFSFYEDNEGVGDINCTSNTTIREDKTARFTCYGADIPDSYDSIEVYDNAYYE